MRNVMMALAALAALGGCAMDTPTPQARAEVEQATSPGGAVPVAHSHPIIDAQGDSVPCSAYPGPGSVGACVQR